MNSPNGAHLDLGCGSLQFPSSEELSQLLEIKVRRIVRVSGGGSLGSTSIQDLPELNFPVEEGQFHC